MTVSASGIRPSLIAAALLLALAACSGSDSPPPSPSASHSVGGTVTGLSGSGLTLVNNGGSALSIGSNVPFTLPGTVPVGGAYNVTVSSQPTNPKQTCTVTHGTGTISGSDITNVEVACTTNRYTVGGTVSGLTGSGLVLTNNGGDALSVAASGAFTFATPVASGGAYLVGVQAQPIGPPQSCVAGSATGTVAADNVTSVTVTCTTNTYRVGGYVSGLMGSGLMLTYNGGAAFVVNRNGAFTAATGVAGGANYNVAIGSQPTNPAQSCTVNNASGALGTADVASIRVLCPQATGRFGYVTGVGGTLSVYSINPATGVLASVPGSSVATGLRAKPLQLFPHVPFAISVNRGDIAGLGSTYEYTVNASTGLLTLVAGSPFTALNGTNSDAGCFAGRGSTQAVTFSPDGAFGYVTNGGQMGAQNRGVWQFTLDPTTGAPSLVAGTHILECNQPSSVTIDPSGQFAYVPAYSAPQPAPNSDPAIFTYSIDPANGALIPVGSTTVLGPVWPFGNVTVDPAGRIAFLVDGSTANVWIFTVDSANGTLSPLAGGPLVTTAPARAIAIDPASNFAYVAQNNGVAIYAINFATGALTPVAADPLVSLTNVVELQIDPSGKFLYASANAGLGATGIYGYSINSSSGALTAIPGNPFASNATIDPVHITVAN